MRQPPILAILFVIFTSSLASSQEILVRKKPDPSVLPPGVQLKRSAVHIEIRCKDGNLPVTGSGTGFLVAYGDPRLPSGAYFYYLVTNRHVAECWDEHNHTRAVDSADIRVNTKDGSARILPLDPKRWQFPSDDSVDLAITPVKPPGDLQIVAFRTDDFATKEFLSNNQIAEGSPIVLSGYFYQFPGQRRFESIVRQGILSMIPDEPMITTTGKPGTIYLGDVHIFGGNSGSPVVVSADALGINGYHLLGIVSGYYYEDAEFNLEIATTIKGTTHANSGVAMIVPVDFLKSLFDAPDVKGPREVYFSHLATPPAATH